MAAPVPALTAFLKSHGTASAPLPEHWLAAGSRLVAPGRTGFPRRPRIEPGDRLVLYASGWRCIFGVAEVTGEPEHDATASERWPWSVAVELLVVVAVLSNAPPLEAIGVAPRIDEPAVPHPARTATSGARAGGAGGGGALTNPARDPHGTATPAA
ncbi:MAG: hypothetical protein ACRDMZ_20555 [Solirubrobacteraceae bacterium]